VNYIADFGEPTTLFLFAGLMTYPVGRYVLFHEFMHPDFRIAAQRVIETSDQDSSMFWWEKNRVDKDRDGCLLDAADKQEMAWIMLQCEEWKS